MNVELRPVPGVKISAEVHDGKVIFIPKEISHEKPAKVAKEHLPRNQSYPPNSHGMKNKKKSSDPNEGADHIHEVSIAQLHTLANKSHSNSSDALVKKNTRPPVNSTEFSQEEVSEEQSSRDSTKSKRHKKNNKTPKQSPERSRKKVTAISTPAEDAENAPQPPIPMVPPHNLKSELLLTPYEALVEQDRQNYLNLQRELSRLEQELHQHSGCTIKQLTELEELAKETRIAMKQQIFNMNRLFDPDNVNAFFEKFYDPKVSLEFFGPQMRGMFRTANFEELNGILNFYFPLKLNKDKDNLKKILRLIVFQDKEQQKRMVDSWLNSPTLPPKATNKEITEAWLEKSKNQFFLLCQYKKAIQFLAEKIYRETTATENKMINLKEVDHIIDRLKKAYSGQKEEFRIFLIEAISIRFLEGIFEPWLIRKGQEVIQNYENTPEADVLHHSGLIQDFQTKFHTLQKVNSEDWEKFLKAGTLHWKDHQGNVILGPFETKDLYTEEKIRKGIKAYVIQCQRVVGEQLFNDGELMVKTCRWANRAAKRKLPHHPNETKLDEQKRIMDYLSSLEEESNRTEAENFMTGLLTKVQDWNNSRELPNQNINSNPALIPTMIYYLKIFYRISCLQFSWAGMGAVMKALSELHPSSRSMIYSLDWPEVFKNSFDIEFLKHSIRFRIIRRDALGLGKKSPAMHLVVQEVIFNYHLPDADGVKVEEPVSIKFYTQTLRDWDKYREPLNELRNIFLQGLRILGYPRPLNIPLA